MTIRKILKNSYLTPLDAELLLSFILKKPREHTLTHPGKPINVAQVKKFEKLVRRRAKEEPVAYMTGRKEFYGLEFFVNKNVLIPRPETELIVEAALQRIMNYESGIMDIVDLGTGSGNIITSIVKSLPAHIRKNARFFALDISKKALSVAKKNAKKHGVIKFIEFVKSDLLEYFLKRKNLLAENLIIIANLPYVSPKIYQKNKNSLKYEPKIALASQNNGLGHYKYLFRQIRDIRKSCYMLRVTCFVEISPEQKLPILKIIKEQLPKARTNFFKDLSGKWRVAEIRALVDKNPL